MTPRPPARPGSGLKPANLRAGVGCGALLTGICLVRRTLRPHRAVRRSPPPRRARPAPLRPAPRPEEGPRWQKLAAGAARRAEAAPAGMGGDRCVEQTEVDAACRPDAGHARRGAVAGAGPDVRLGQADPCGKRPGATALSGSQAGPALRPPFALGRLPGPAARAEERARGPRRGGAQGAAGCSTGRGNRLRAGRPVESATVPRPSRTSFRTRPTRRRRGRSAPR